METDISKIFLDRPKNYNNITSEEYEEFIKSDESFNPFLIFKCAKEVFSSTIKYNACLYISIIFLVVQIILLDFYTISKSKYIIKEEKKEEDKINENSDKKKNEKKIVDQKKKELKANPPKVGNFSIDDDLEEEGNSVNENNKNDLEKGMQEKHEEKFHNNDSELSDKGKDFDNNMQDKEIDNITLKDTKNEKPNLGVELIDETETNHHKKRRQIISTENEEDDEEEKDNDTIVEEGEYSNKPKEINKKGLKKKKNEKIKLIILDEKDVHGEEGGEVKNDKQNKNTKNSKNNIKINVIREDFFTNKDSYTESELNKARENNNQKKEEMTFTEIIKNPSTPFSYYYWKLFQLKQPIVALFSPINSLKIEESYIPTMVKLMRIIFILSLNIFFNILHLEQKYFRKKFEYFNNKYQLRYTFLEAKISSSELFSYGFGHAYAAGLISFLICLIIQSVLNYFFFDLKKKLNMNEKDKTKKEILQFMKNIRRCFIIFFAISLGIMVIIFYAAITFAQVYRGGVLDLVAGGLWTFIFLQIIPFLLCLVFALFRYYGIKKNKQILYDLSLAVFF